jgi:hypothetical protein
MWIFVFSNLEDFISGRSDGSIGGLRHNLGLDPAGIVLPDHLHKQYCIPDQLHKQYCIPDQLYKQYCIQKAKTDLKVLSSVMDSAKIRLIR